MYVFMNVIIEVCSENLGILWHLAETLCNSIHGGI